MTQRSDLVSDGALGEAAPPLAAPPYEPGVIEAAVANACKRIAPLWPLKHFVAVNPFLGFSAQTFHATCATMHASRASRCSCRASSIARLSHRATSKTKISNERCGPFPTIGARRIR